jgi:hypothetical protein
VTRRGPGPPAAGPAALVTVYQAAADSASESGPGVRLGVAREVEGAAGTAGDSDSDSESLWHSGWQRRLLPLALWQWHRA